MNQHKRLASAILARSDGMWERRAVALLDFLSATDIDLSRSAAELLDDMDSVKGQHPNIALFLDCLPGYPDDRKHAVHTLAFLTMQWQKLLNEAATP